MGFQCALQVKGLVRGEPKLSHGKPQRHRANGGKILREMGNERQSRTLHLDRALSSQNVYEGYESGQDCWDELCAMAEQGSAYTRTNKKTGEKTTAYRKVRSDAVIGWAVITHPADEVTKDWTWEQFRKFDEDAMEVLAEIEPRVFRRDNEMMRVEHHDEIGKHSHHCGVSRDAQGKYCGNIIDTKFFRRLNAEFPRMMRERGWEVDDVEQTDWDRLKDDPEYQAEVLKKLDSQSLDTNAYVQAKHEKRVAELQQQTLEASENLEHTLREQSLTEKVVADNKQTIDEQREELSRIGEQQRNETLNLLVTQKQRESAESEIAVHEERLSQIKIEQRHAEAARDTANKDAKEIVHKAKKHKREADKIVDDAKAEAERTRSDADDYAKRTYDDANNRLRELNEREAAQKAREALLDEREKEQSEVADELLTQQSELAVLQSLNETAADEIYDANIQENKSMSDVVNSFFDWVEGRFGSRPGVKEACNWMRNKVSEWVNHMNGEAQTAHEERMQKIRPQYDDDMFGEKASREAVEKALGPHGMVTPANTHSGYSGHAGHGGLGL